MLQQPARAGARARPASRTRSARRSPRRSSEHEVILFMKGTPEAPACGFSARTVAVLQALDTPFAAVDVLPDPRIRQELSAISNWPTDPAAVRRGRAGRRLRHRHARCTSRGSWRRRCCSVPRRMPPVAVATDSTHYLPRALADSAGHPPGQPVRGLAGANRSASSRWTASTPSTSGCAATPSCPPPPSPRSATSSPCGSR